MVTALVATQFLDTSQNPRASRETFRKSKSRWKWLRRKKQTGMQRPLPALSPSFAAIVSQLVLGKNVTEKLSFLQDWPDFLCFLSLLDGDLLS